MEVTSPIATAPAAATPAQTSGTEISSDFETFLKMLTVQLENQDPLNPIESSDYAVQLATFSGVEQQVQTNDLLKALQTQLGSSGLSDLANWVGKEARVPGPITFDGQPLTLYTNPVSTAEAADIVVRDGAGLEIGRFDIPTTGGQIEWAGVTSDGAPFPPGTYSFDVQSYDGETVLETSQAEAFSQVQEVQKQDGQTVLIMANGAQVAANDVTALRAPQGG